MIQIFTKNTELKLLKGATLNVELNNALFAAPDIEGDIVFSFNIPVEGNETVLGFAHKPYCDGAFKMPCTVECHGIAAWKGNLVVQKSANDTYSAAVVLNPYPDGFAKRLLSENYDNRIVISPEKSAHNSAWQQFLTDSVDNPDVKFAPFFNEDGYGSDNDNYGFWNGKQRDKIVNALFFEEHGQLAISSGFPFSQPFNQCFKLTVEDETSTEDSPSYSQYNEVNQLAFCPQIRLARVFRIWCRNAGYAFINHLGEDYEQTFLQSQKSLDGTVAQYIDATAEITIKATIPYSEVEEYSWNADKSPWVDMIKWSSQLEATDGTSAEYISGGAAMPPFSGWWDITLHTKFDGKWEAYGDLSKTKVVLCMFCGNMTVDDLENGNGVLERWEMQPVERMSQYHWEYTRVLSVHTALKINVSQTPDIHFVLYSYKEKNNGKKKPVKLFMAGLDVTMRKISADNEQQGFNIFRSSFRIPECCPEVDNATFLKTMIETLGLCYFISNKTKSIEIVPYRSLILAKSLDLSDYELVEETEMSETESPRQTFRMKPMKDERYAEHLRIDDVEEDLPDAYQHHERFCLCRKTNTLYRAVVEESENSNYIEEWKEYSGNPDTLEIGDGKEHAIETSVAIPHQRFFGSAMLKKDKDVLSFETPQLTVADFTISSDLYNCNENPSDIILTQYRGFRKRTITHKRGERYVYNEVMLPVWADGFSLTAKGENSVGEKYVKPVLELNRHRTITYKFRIPALMVSEIDSLLRPSELAPERQTRFIIVRNVKSVPKRIQFQFENNEDDTVLCQIEAVKAY